MSLNTSSLNANDLLNRKSLTEYQRTFNQDEDTLLNDFIKEKNIMGDKQIENSSVENNIIELSEFKKSLLGFVIDQNNKIMELIKQ